MAYSRAARRRDTGLPGGSSGGVPDPRQWPAVWQLIAINVLVYILWQMPSLRGLMIDHFVVSSESVGSLRLWTLITSAFSQVQPGHLFGNLLGLYFFGRSIEAAFGRRQLWGLYLGGALVAAVAHLGWEFVTGGGAPALGASGAVLALGAVFAALWPKRTFLLWFVVPMPAWLLVTLYTVWDLSAALGGAADGVAHFAHLGGVAFGLGWVWWRGHLRLPRFARR